MVHLRVERLMWGSVDWLMWRGIRETGTVMHTRCCVWQCMLLRDAGGEAAESRVDGTARATRFAHALLTRENVTERVHTLALCAVPCHIVKVRLDVWRGVGRLITALWCPRRSAGPGFGEKLHELVLLP